LIEQGTLDNGVTLLCDPVPTTEVCAIGFWYPHGSRDEAAAERGYSHFLEHMLFKGTAHRSALDIAVDVDRVGGSINAFTDREVTCYYCVLPADHADLALEILCDMVSSAVLTEAEIAKEKLVVINEIRAAEDSPDEKGYQMFVDGLWRSHPLAAKVAGEEQQVERIDRTPLVEFYRRRYRPCNLTVSAAGALEFDHVAGVLSTHLVRDGAPPGTAASRERPQRFVTREFVRDRYHQAQIYVGTTLEPVVDFETYLAFVLLSTAFGESMSSRLFQRIREDLGLCYSVGSFRTHFTDTWSWVIYANAMPELVPQLLGALNREMDRLAQEPLSVQEVSDAVSHIAGSMVFAKEDMESRMKRLASQYQMFGRTIELSESARTLRQVSATEVASLTARIMQRGCFNLLSYGTSNMSGMRSVPFDW
jgi:predicted Zn-dependent peptidase